MKNFKKFEMTKGDLKAVKGGKIDESTCESLDGFIMVIGGEDHCVFH
ncbi:hypothetical protein [uncultured Microscilla sp.]|nr:hypothetical protein [uncultured Microscilla sp.]